MPRHIALLRGINVGGHNRILMADLRRVFAAAGAQNVMTYIQSGNVVFDAGHAADVTDSVQHLLAEEHGVRSPIITRTGDEVAAAVEANPFLARGAEESLLHVMFLADEPGKDAIDSLEPDRSPGDRFIVHAHEIFLCCPSGLAKTRLTNAYFESRLDTFITTRNWRTIQKLLAMARE